MELDNFLATQKQQLNTIKQELETYGKTYDVNFSHIENLIDDQNKFLDSPSLEIAIVGSVKAGKSTLINSILSEEVSSMEVTPETASLTKIRYTENITLKVDYYSYKEWNKFWNSVQSSSNNGIFLEEYKTHSADSIKDDYIGKESVSLTFDTIEALKTELKKFNSSQSSSHYFVKEVEVGIPFFPFSKQVCLVDTPGLNDVVEYRSNITKNYIKRANIVIICVSAEALRNDEYTTIVKTFENVVTSKDRVFILGTKLDKLNNPKKDWDRQKTEWNKYFKGMYSNEENLHTNIWGVSAYIDYLVDKIENKKELHDGELIDITNFCKKNGVVLKKKMLSFFQSDVAKIKNNLREINGVTNMDSFVETLNVNKLKALDSIIMEDVSSRHNVLLSELKSKIENIKAEIKENEEILLSDLDSLKQKKEDLDNEEQEIQLAKNSINTDFTHIKGLISTKITEIQVQTKNNFSMS